MFNPKKYLTLFFLISIMVPGSMLWGQNYSLSFDGEDDYATVEVSVLQVGETEVTFDGSEVFRDPDNNDVLINETVAGLVVVE